jgi:GNAT superfamily N-acetyltransferase
MDIYIDEATASDLPAILSLYAQLGQDDGRVLDPVAAGHIFARMQTYPDYRLYVVHHADRVAATFALLIMDNLGHCGARSAILEDVVVAEEMRGQGIGRLILAHVVALCRGKACYKLALSSNRHREAAHRFYESLGLERHGYSYLLPLPRIKEQRQCEADGGTPPGQAPVFQLQVPTP